MKLIENKHTFFLFSLYFCRYFSSCVFFFNPLSLSHCLIVCRIEGIGLILITHCNTLTSPLLSLHWSLVPKPLTSYWQGAQNSASVCVHACVELMQVTCGWDLLSWWSEPITLLVVCVYVCLCVCKIWRESGRRKYFYIKYLIENWAAHI